jgi:Uma2 family endonuclease
MAMLAASEKRWTVEELHALPDDPRRRYQLVDGERLVSQAPTPLHQVCVIELVSLLHAYLERSDFGLVLTGPGEIIPDDRTALQPDVFVVPLVGGVIPAGKAPERALLAAEVLSPGTARFDRVVKRPAYFRMDAVYWIVDPDARVFERWMPAASRPDILDDEVFWFPAGASEPLVIDLEAYFQRVFRFFSPDNR